MSTTKHSKSSPRPVQQMQSFIRIVGIMPNPFGWRRRHGSVTGGDARIVNVYKKWDKWGVYIETLENTISPSLHFQADYTVNRIALPFTRGSIATDFINLMMWTLKVLTTLVSWRARSRSKFFNVVISQSGISHTFHGWLASKLLDAKHILLLQNPGDYNPSPYVGYMRWKYHGAGSFASVIRGLGDWFSSLFFRRADAYICISKLIAETIGKLGIPRDAIFVTGNGLDLERIARAPMSEKSFDAIYLGRIEAWKGVSDVLQTWKMVVHSFENAKLIVVGTGDFLVEAKGLVEELGIRDNVTFTGYVPEDVKYSMLKKSRMLIFPSKGLEGLPLVIMEALACGIPVVCYSSPSLVSVFDDCESVLFTPKGDISSLFSVTSKLLSDADLREKYGQLAKQYSRKFSWDVLAEREIQIISNVVRNGQETHNEN